MTTPLKKTPLKKYPNQEKIVESFVQRNTPEKANKKVNFISIKKHKILKKSQK